MPGSSANVYLIPLPHPRQVSGRLDRAAGPLRRWRDPVEVKNTLNDRKGHSSRMDYGMVKLIKIDTCRATKRHHAMFLCKICERKLRMESTS